MCRLYNRLTAKAPDLWKKYLHSGTSTWGFFPRPTLCSSLACPVCGREWARTLWGPRGIRLIHWPFFCGGGFELEGNCVCHFGRSWVWPCCWPILKPMKVGTCMWIQRLVITSCACGCDLLMFLGFGVPSWVLGCLKNWNQKVISFASTVLCACRYVPHVLGLYVPHFACI